MYNRTEIVEQTIISNEYEFIRVNNQLNIRLETKSSRIS